MSETDEVTGRLQARMAYLGIRDKAPTADLLPTRSMPFGLTLPDCRDVAAFLLRVVRGTYTRCRRNQRELATRRPDGYGDDRLARWDGGYDWSGRYHAPIWARIAGRRWSADSTSRITSNHSMRRAAGGRAAVSQQAVVARGPGALRA